MARNRDFRDFSLRPSGPYWEDKHGKVNVLHRVTGSSKPFSGVSEQGTPGSLNREHWIPEQGWRDAEQRTGKCRTAITDPRLDGLAVEVSPLGRPSQRDGLVHQTIKRQGRRLSAIEDSLLQIWSEESQTHDFSLVGTGGRPAVEADQ